jgi:hypothetical protein
MPDPAGPSREGAKVSFANSVATVVLIWAIIYDLFAYLPWRMAVLILAAAVAALVLLFRSPQDLTKATDDLMG